MECAGGVEAIIVTSKILIKLHDASRAVVSV